MRTPTLPESLLRNISVIDAAKNCAISGLIEVYSALFTKNEKLPGYILKAVAIYAAETSEGNKSHPPCECRLSVIPLYLNGAHLDFCSVYFFVM